MAAVDEFQHALKMFDRAITEVIKHPCGPKRWRAANDLWLSLSSKHRRAYREVCKENALVRSMVDKHGQAIGASRAEQADKTLRNALNIPAGAYVVISKADPTTFTEKSNARKFFKEFPEYCTRSVF